MIQREYYLMPDLILVCLFLDPRYKIMFTDNQKQQAKNHLISVYNHKEELLKNCIDLKILSTGTSPTTLNACKDVNGHEDELELMLAQKENEQSNFTAQTKQHKNRYNCLTGNRCIPYMVYLNNSPLNIFRFIVLICCLLLHQINAARILCIFAFPGKSHSMMLKAITKELTFRGHEVTMVTNFPMEEKLENYTEILIEPIYDFWSDIKHLFKTDNLFELTEMKLTDIIDMMDLIGTTTTEHALKHPRIQELIHDNEKQYDLIIAEQFYQEAFLVLAHKYKVPVVTISTLGFENYMSQMMGVLTPWSHVPHGFVAYDDKMPFFERFMNTFYSLYEDYDREFSYFPKQDKLVEKYLSHIPGPIPTVSQMEKNVSLILLNSHIPLTTSRPSVMGMVQVGGVHIKNPKPLPNDIQQFLDGATEGAIYFSLGTNLRSSDIPPEKLNVFFNVFGSIKQRILWKWEDEKIPNLPKNVMVKKWLPQSDILAHRNIKVFITHGGLFGTQEGVYRGVPLLGIPVYCDQHLNMNKATKAGYAISLYFPNITENSLNWALNELMFNPSYTNTMRRTSQVFRDRPISAMESAMYWIEYVIRYNGAPQIRSSGIDLPWYSYYLLDVITVIVAVLASILLFIIFILKCIFKQNGKEKVH